MEREFRFHGAAGRRSWRLCADNGEPRFKPAAGTSNAYLQDGPLSWRGRKMFPLSLLGFAVATIAVAASSVNGSGTIRFGQSVEHISVTASGSSGRATFEDRAAG